MKSANTRVKFKLNINGKSCENADTDAGQRPPDSSCAAGRTGRGALTNTEEDSA